MFPVIYKNETLLNKDQNCSRKEEKPIENCAKHEEVITHYQKNKYKVVIHALGGPKLSA